MHGTRGFVSRNRIFQMNKKDVTVEKRPIVNEGLFTLPDEISTREEIPVDIAYSNMPCAVGLMANTYDNVRNYYVYENDEDGEKKWSEMFSEFNLALNFARTVYDFKMNGLMYEKYGSDNVRTLRR